jgi:hypothetical protein
MIEIRVSFFFLFFFGLYWSSSFGLNEFCEHLKSGED